MNFKDLINPDNARALLNTAREGKKVGGETIDGKVGEPQRSYLFEVDVSGDSSGVSGQSSFRFYVRTATVPPSSREVIDRPFLGNTFKFPGRESSAKELTVTFWDDENWTVYNYLYKWKELAGTWDTNQALPKVAASRTMSIKMKDTSDMAVTKRFDFRNVIPTEIGEISVSYDSSELIEFSATFLYDFKKEVKDA